MNKFEIDTNEIHVANSEDSVSKTIEELLSVNDQISAHTDSEVTEVTQTQFDNSDYEGKSSRGEVSEVTERQFEDRNDDETPIQEIQIENASESDGGHRSEMWDLNDKKVRGHESVAPIWHSVYRQEDDRKKMDKGQLKKGLK